MDVGLVRQIGVPAEHGGDVVRPPPGDQNDAVPQVLDRAVQGPVGEVVPVVAVGHDDDAHVLLDESGVPQRIHDPHASDGLVEDRILRRLRRRLGDGSVPDGGGSEIGRLDGVVVLLEHLQELLPLLGVDVDDADPVPVALLGSDAPVVADGHVPLSGYAVELALVAGVAKGRPAVEVADEGILLPGHALDDPVLEDQGHAGGPSHLLAAELGGDHFASGLLVQIAFEDLVRGHAAAEQVDAVQVVGDVLQERLQAGHLAGGGAEQDLLSGLQGLLDLHVDVSGLGLDVLRFQKREHVVHVVDVPLLQVELLVEGGSAHPSSVLDETIGEGAEDSSGRALPLVLRTFDGIRLGGLGSGIVRMKDGTGPDAPSALDALVVVNLGVSESASESGLPELHRDRVGRAYVGAYAAAGALEQGEF